MIFQVKVLLLAALCTQGCLSTAAAEPNRETMRETMPLYTVLSDLDQLNATQCRNELEQLRDAVDHNILWGMRLLDVSGSPGSGFTIGNNFWPGSRLGCYFINSKKMLPLSTNFLRNVSHYRDPKTEFPPYPVQYYIARFKHNSTQQYHFGIKGQDNMVLGMCLPSSCTVDELEVIMEKIFRDRTLLVGQLYSADFKLGEVSDLTDDHQWLLSGQKIMAILVLLTSLGLVVVGTVYDIMFYQKRLQKNRKFLTFENNNTAELKNDVEAKGEPEPESLSLDEHKPQTMTGKILMCFSVTTNAKQIFTLETGPDNIPVLNGIKTLSMVWIIFVHTTYYTNNFMANASVGAMFTDGLLVQIISNATFSVDTFLCVTGFLMGVVFLKAMRKEKQVSTFSVRAMQFVLQAIKRFIRLTPAYLIVIMIAILNYTYYDHTASFEMFESPSYYCSRYWWRNLLYINNLYPWDELCLSWSWYIANDMQFFLYGTVLLMLYNWRSSVGLSLGAVTLLACALTNGYLAYVLDFVPTVDDVHRTLSELYMRPWLRIGPFLVGLIAATIVHRMNYKMNLTMRGKVLGWTMGVLCNCSILFGGVERDLGLHLSIIYTAITRILWGVGVAWLIVACITNNGGIVNKILSLQIWIPFSRLTYSAYLVNPLIITSINLYNYYPHYFDTMSTASVSVGLVVTSYVCSILLSLLAEAPAINILRILTNPNRRMK